MVCSAQPTGRPAPNALRVVGLAIDQLEAAADGLQQVVEVVRQSAGELADRGDAMALLQGRVGAGVVRQRGRDLALELFRVSALGDVHGPQADQRRGLAGQGL
jgi:hypothetical protein